jgi:ribonuclease P protein component
VLPPAARLRRRTEFALAVRRGRRGAAAGLVVHLATDAGAGPRAGFVVNRAVGSAVARNRVRRQLRHLVRDRLETLPAGARLVVRATPEAPRLDSATLGSSLDRALAAAARGRAQ